MPDICWDVLFLILAFQIPLSLAAVINRPPVIVKQVGFCLHPWIKSVDGVHFSRSTLLTGPN